MRENENQQPINRDRDTETVLKEYAMYVQYIEDFGRVKKVYSDRGTFALKSIVPHKGIDFIRNVQKLYHRGYNRIVPIYQTMDQRYAVLHNGRLYYLMPWLNNEGDGERDEKHKQMFRELARMHTLSVKEIQVDIEEREAHYERTLDAWNNEKDFMDEYIVSCEKKWYMSPFEMTVCSFFTDISQALKYSIKKFETWYEKTKESEKVRTVITHGKVSLKHFVSDERGYGYFINFENSNTAPPHFDLLPFLIKSARTYPVQCDDCVDWLYNYFRYFPLKEEELLLMQSYMAFPGSALELVKGYSDGRSHRSELDNVTQLQRQFWLLKNVEYMVMKIEEIEQKKKAAAEAAKEEQSPPS
ncbi:spore coat protein YsxE [Peribacillus simplex]|uniref:spore coat protein YsxE n=1 Tax=Peribacillus simplex TaxID=1478 RepID=UPI000B046874|nr:spore coat protein YsxE [Peribacillus simplex]MDM5293671.1 spore coat protein YsxE [Peribacillus simplex]